MLCFHRRFGEWPSRVGAVSWKFKALRFYLIACGLRLADGRFRFFGSGDPSGQPAIEAFAAASVQYDAAIVRGGEIVDPLHRDGQWFGEKRLGRMPREFATNADYLAAGETGVRRWRADRPDGIHRSGARLARRRLALAAITGLLSRGRPARRPVGASGNASCYKTSV